MAYNRYCDTSGKKQKLWVRPVDTAIPSMIPEGDPDLTFYLSELLGTNKPKQQSNAFWFPTPKKPGKTEYHTPIQTRILKELCELKRKKTEPKRWHRITKEIF